ncbi:MAG TPA: hypothetical protein VD931_21270 [Baekduia sp.]|nr:hypothetical protein [Baekduia sp.]
MDELEVLRVRDEVLQAMYWMRSEGLGDAPQADELGRFLAVPAATLTVFLERFVADGLLERAGGGFRLSAAGEEAGKRTFADEMAELTGSTHGECDEDCWCHQSPEAAAACLEERSGHVHRH